MFFLSIFKLSDISALESELSSRILSINSLQGVLVLFLVAYIAWKFFKDVPRFIAWVIALIVFLEIGHVASKGTLGNMIPVLKIIFKYDVFQSLAQLCVGTPVCKFLLYVQSYLNNTFGLAFEAAIVLCKRLYEMIGNPLDIFKQLGNN